MAGAKRRGEPPDITEKDLAAALPRGHENLRVPVLFGERVKRLERPSGRPVAELPAANRWSRDLRSGPGLGIDQGDPQVFDGRAANRRLGGGRDAAECPPQFCGRFSLPGIGARGQPVR
jgi:hypothetical protein